MLNKFIWSLLLVLLIALSATATILDEVDGFGDTEAQYAKVLK